MLRRFFIIGFILLVAACFKNTVDVGDKAVAFSLPGLNQKIIKFDPEIDRVKILYFWADWCPRCSEDFVQLERFYQEWKRDPDGPLLFTVDVGQTVEHVRHFVKRLHVTFSVALDRDGKIARKYGVKGLPTYFIIDRKGIIRYKILGWAEEKVLKDYLNRVSH